MPGMRSLPLDAVQKLLNTLPSKYAALTAIGVGTGCRISEILALRRFDLLTSTGEFKPEIAFVKLKTRANQRRHRKLAIPDALQPYILRHLREEEQRGYERPDDLVFRGQLGRPLSRLTVYHFFRNHLGEGHGTHWMRKTFAQELYRYFCRQNPDTMRATELVRRALGHARIDTTIKYLGLNYSPIGEAQNAIFNHNHLKGKDHEKIHTSIALHHHQLRR